MQHSFSPALPPSYARWILAALALAGAGLLGSSALNFIAILDQKEGASPRAERVPAAAPGVEAITRLNWFGVSPEDANTNEAQGVLELKGISQAKNAAFAGAYIAERGKPEAYFRVGDALPAGSGILKEVLADHVVVERAGVRIVLGFARSDAQAPAIKPPEAAGANPFFTLPPDKVVKTLPPPSPAELAKRFATDPEALLAEAGLQSVEADAKKGYRFSGEDAQRVFDSVQLRKGDVIVSVNGSAVGNPKTDRLLMPTLLTAKTLTLDVLRDGKTVKVDYTIP